MARQDCMQSRQDYIIAIKEKRRDTGRKENRPGDAETRGVCKVMWRSGLSRQHVGNACGVSRSSKEGRFGLAV